MTTPSVTLTIDGISVTVDAGTTILKAARQAGIESIPTLCYHDYCTANGLCRVCVVEVEGSRTLIPSCCTKVTEGMKVQTRSTRGVRVCTFIPSMALVQQEGMRVREPSTSTTHTRHRPFAVQ